MIMLNNSSVDTTDRGGLFTDERSRFTTTYTLERTANHTEISIMKTQWNSICKKINAIKIKKFTLNLQEIIVGAAIPYIIDIISDCLTKESPNYFPVFICIVLFFVNSVAKKIIPICNDCSAENQIHLDDIKEIIEEIDKMEGEN